jgi:hypothetical protein
MCERHHPLVRTVTSSHVTQAIHTGKLLNGAVAIFDLTRSLKCDYVNVESALAHDGYMPARDSCDPVCAALRSVCVGFLPPCGLLVWPLTLSSRVPSGCNDPPWRVWMQRTQRARRPAVVLTKMQEWARVVSPEQVRLTRLWWRRPSDGLCMHCSSSHTSWSVPTSNWHSPFYRRCALRCTQAIVPGHCALCLCPRQPPPRPLLLPRRRTPEHSLGSVLRDWQRHSGMSVVSRAPTDWQWSNTSAGARSDQLYACTQ